MLKNPGDNNLDSKPEANSRTCCDANLVRLRAVNKTYGIGPTSQVVLEGVDLEVKAGEFVVILGRSGSGKSSLLNLLGAMDRPTTGEVWIGADLISALSDHERTLFRRTHLGFIFQAYNLIPSLTVLENVLLPLSLNGERSEAAAKEILAILGLGSKFSTSAEELSGGEQQRVAIARALVHKPKLILADEPTGNLDVDTAQSIMNLLDRLVRENGQTLIMATHSREVMAHADRVLGVQHRRLVELQR